MSSSSTLEKLVNGNITFEECSKERKSAKKKKIDLEKMAREIEVNFSAHMLMATKSQPRSFFQVLDPYSKVSRHLYLETLQAL